MKLTAWNNTPAKPRPITRTLAELAREFGTTAPHLAGALSQHRATAPKAVITTTGTKPRCYYDAAQMRRWWQQLKEKKC